MGMEPYRICERPDFIERRYCPLQRIGAEARKRCNLTIEKWAVRRPYCTVCRFWESNRSRPLERGLIWGLLALPGGIYHLDSI